MKLPRLSPDTTLYLNKLMAALVLLLLATTFAAEPTWLLALAICLLALTLLSMDELSSALIGLHKNIMADLTALSAVTSKLRSDGENKKNE